MSRPSFQIHCTQRNLKKVLQEQRLQVRPRQALHILFALKEIAVVFFDELRHTTKENFYLMPQVFLDQKNHRYTGFHLPLGEGYHGMFAP